MDEGCKVWKDASGAFSVKRPLPWLEIASNWKGRAGWVGSDDGASVETIVISTLGQLRLIILAATIGTIVGSLVLLPRDDLRPGAIAAVAGIALLALTFAAGRLPLTRVPSVAVAHRPPALPRRDGSSTANANRNIDPRDSPADTDRRADANGNVAPPHLAAAAHAPGTSVRAHTSRDRCCRNGRVRPG